MERLTKHYSDDLTGPEEVLLQAQEWAVSEMKADINTTGQAYAMIDGSMLQTREGTQHNDWKEVKLGRIFIDSDHLSVDKDHNWLKKSVYSAYMGNYKSFLAYFEPLTDILEPLGDRMVFIGDGASWMWKWVNEAYPKATQILDFYHGMEHLSDFSKLYFKDKEVRKKWLATQKIDLLNDRIETIIAKLRMLACKTKKISEGQQKLLTYLNNNKTRMRYKTFRDRELFIGSGAIESAHRTVLQKRLKQSGQRWTQKGAQQIINLRLMNMNGQWHRVIDLIKHKEQKQYVKAA